jgi:hypothetical protein
MRGVHTLSVTYKRLKQVAPTVLVVVPEQLAVSVRGVDRLRHCVISAPRSTGSLS